MALTRTKVIIINGVQESGKDTFIKFVEDYCNMNESANVLNLSSVDPIKDVLSGFGWDGNKTEEVRNIIAGIKKIWTNAQNGPTMFLMHNILAFHMANVEEDNIIFCHIREPKDIKKLVDIISGMETVGIDIMTMFIVRGDTAVSTDVRDSDNPNLISQYPYDKIIHNDSDLPTLDEKACEFINELF